ncbi:MAG TPA: hypothetical protein VIM61_00685 [Chthoniobacterales bacterium]
MSKTRRSVPLSDILPRDLPALLHEHSRLGMGYDIATTTKEKSNPSSLSVVEQIGLDYYVRLILRWKTADPAVARAVITAVLMLIAPRRPVKLCVDASNEKYYAADLKRDLAGIVVTDLVVSGEATEYLGEKMSFKTYLGNLLVHTMEEGHLFLADHVWIKNDFRLVTRDRGGFVTEVDAGGNHGDTFDSTKLALHALIGPGGPVTAAAAAVGNFARPSTGGRVLRNPYAHLFNRQTSRVNA